MYGLGQLPIIFMGMIVHGHIDQIYAQYSNELWLNDHNWVLVVAFVNVRGS
jgi:hypothetical protein